MASKKQNIMLYSIILNLNTVWIQRAETVKKNKSWWNIMDKLPFQ